MSTEGQNLGSAELFPTDAPLRTEELIGRSADVARVAQGLMGGENIVVVGPRRTGKTSVGDAALAACARGGAYVVRVDLFELPDAATFAHELSLSVLANRPVLRRAIATAGGAPAKLIDALSAAATLRARHDLGEDIEITLSPSRADVDPHAALRAAFALPQRIGRADDRRVVVFFDEFQELASGRFGDPDLVAKQLRAQLQRARAVSTLFAGSVEHVMRDLFAPSERALSQFGSQYTLAPIVREEWHEGLSARFAKARMTSTRTALDRLIDAAEGQPRTTMLLAQQSHAELIDLAENRLDDAIVIRGIERAMRADRLRHVQLLEQINQLGTYGHRVAQRVARGESPWNGIPPEQARRVLGALERAGIVARGPERGSWTVTEPLFRRYLATALHDRRRGV